MARPSRNLDQALLAAGRALLPARGCAGLSVREVAESAGVNLGMFHYHFRTRDAFLRAVLQQAYEEMFARLTLEIRGEIAPACHLRAALRVLGRFLRDNRAFVARILADALTGEPSARQFIGENLPRHLFVLRSLVAQGQAAGALREMPLEQAIGICAGALALPILVGGAVAESGMVPKSAARTIERTLLSDAALDERIDRALAALAPDAPRSRSTRAKRRRTTS
jgi:AcrR family transcriptional regulator